MLKITGPSLEKGLWDHQMVKLETGNLIIIGGEEYSNGNYAYPDSLRKLICINQNCTWEILSQTLDQGRYDNVAFVVTDTFCRWISSQLLVASNVWGDFISYFLIIFFLRRFLKINNSGFT